MPIHKREIYLTKVFGKEPYWPFHFPEKNVIYDFYGSKQLEQVSKAEPTMGTNYFRSSNFFLCSQKTIQCTMAEMTLTKGSLEIWEFSPNHGY